jgi:hypothetical protein
MHDATAIVNLESYPIHELSGDAGRRLATECKQQYLDNGLCILPDFIRPEALLRLAGEAESVKQNAYFCNSTHNAYLNDANADDSNKGSASQQQETTYVGSVAYDYLAGETELDQLYSWDALKDFIGYVIGKKTLYRLADPFGACSINVFVDGGEHGWHFDESEFTVTLMLQKPAHGGAFEYVPRIRGLPNEESIVSSVLSGDRSRVAELPFTAGTLLIFGGHQTLHRVTRVSGETARLVPVLCYSESPNVVNSEAVRKLFWGRSGPQEH